jgi:hypothetical protein
LLRGLQRVQCIKTISQYSRCVVLVRHAIRASPPPIPGLGRFLHSLNLCAYGYDINSGHRLPISRHHERSAVRAGVLIVRARRQCIDDCRGLLSA